MTAADAKAGPAEPAQPGSGGDAARALAKRGDWAGAAKGFAEAVALAPDDARLVAELGWAEFNAGDLVNARVHTSAALEKITEAPRRGAVLYNFGRILEAQGEPGPAADAYRQSLALRPNKVVQARLKKLPQGAAGAPGASDAAAPELGKCATWGPKAKLCGCFTDTEAHCKLQPFELLADAGLFTMRVEDELGGNQYYLVEGGPHGHAVVGMIGYASEFHWLRGEKIVLKDGRELLRINVDQQEVEDDKDSVDRVITESAHLCVRTPGSGEPARCVLEVPLRVEMRHETLRDPPRPTPPAKVRTARFELKISADGFVNVKQLDGPASVITNQQLTRWVDARKVPIARETTP